MAEVSDIATRIQSELDRIEQEAQVSVLYACESGSRAWGFESEDSDYDVRFIYLHRTEWYLTIQDKRDVIERPLEEGLDVSGWDLTKALELFRKSNPPVLEWLQSPIAYREKSSAVTRMRELMPEYYSPISCMYHYLHMAEGNYRDYLKGDEVRLKKYFYVLRPVLACLWIESGLGVVPTEFRVLMDRLVDDPQLRADIEKLLAAKKQGEEIDVGPRVPSISEFLDKQLSRLTGESQGPAETRDPATLDRLFVEVLKEVNGVGIV